MKRFTSFFIYSSWSTSLLAASLTSANIQIVFPWILLFIMITAVGIFIYHHNHHNDSPLSNTHPSTTLTIPTTPTSLTSLTSPASLPSSFFCENWQLLAFASEFGPTMQVGICHDNNGSSFHAIRFIKPDGTITYAYFFSQLGVLSSSEISRRKHELWIGRTQNNRYYLYATVKEWENVDLDT